MRLLPREKERLELHQAGYLAQKRLARGLRLNRVEALALISTQLQECIRDGGNSVDELMQHGKTILGYRHVLPGVVPLLKEIQVEGTFPDGVFLVTVHNPICTETGNLDAALYGSFLPTPPDDLFPPSVPEDHTAENAPGAVIAKKGVVRINVNRERVSVRVKNIGDRPIQVGSHFHFIETNPSLQFDRGRAYGKRLDIPSGTAVRFEPDSARTVTLVAISGARIISGGNGLATGPYDPRRVNDIVAALIQKGFGHMSQPDAPLVLEESWIERERYIQMFGPTVGDRVRLGDTALWVEVERDETVYGDEVKFGGGKSIREGMGQATGRAAADALDLVITNALIIDWSGIYKADVGVKNGLIVGIGKSGNPDTMSSVPPELVIGSTTEVIAGEKLILTAGAIDTHVHFICPQQVPEALASGVTTHIGGGTGPSAGTSATTCTPSPHDVRMMLAATDGIPINIGLTGKGNDSGSQGMEDVIRAGAAGLKLHEDWGSTPEAIRTCLDVADSYDIQVAIHTDTLNEAGFVDSTIAAFQGRAIHTYHTEGAGGGHAPDIIVVCGQENVLPSSTNPTRPFAKNTIAEHMDMLMVCHHLDPTLDSDVAFAESRIRGETMAAEDMLHDSGAIAMISSDSQAMGRVGEVISRTWRTASKMRECLGPLREMNDAPAEDGSGKGGKDNGRVKRYIAKYTINPALTHGISHIVGDVSVGKLADLVLWKPENFGAKPEMVLKSGIIVVGQMGDANASIGTVQPLSPKSMWGSFPAAAALNSVAFVSAISLDSGTIASYDLKKKAIAVRGCRTVRKKDLKWNTQTPSMHVDPETIAVVADGVLQDVPPAERVPLARGYNFFASRIDCSAECARLIKYIDIWLEEKQVERKGMTKQFHDFKTSNTPLYNVDLVHPVVGIYCDLAYDQAHLYVVESNDRTGEIYLDLTNSDSPH